MADLKRYALVIGNSDYENDFAALPNALNDCHDIGKKLESLGFNVTLKPNQTHNELLSTVDQFSEQINDSLSDIVFYYSGHGCSIQGKNYIIPTDGSNSLRPSLAKRTYFELSEVINILVDSRRLDAIPIIVILDCCRSEVNENGKGLIEDEGKPSNIFIMYATGSDQATSDGFGKNGAFTGLLLKYMDSDEDIESIAIKVRTDLHADSRYKKVQMSWTASSLLKPYNFRMALKQQNKTGDIHSISQKSIFWPKYQENPRFVDRPDIFASLNHAIKMNKENNKFRPIALCGLGGMGKSQIALNFCYKNKEHYRYIFWIDADTESALQSSFLDVAKMLNLPDFDYTKPENIVPQIILWFHSNDEWLLVFDNADDYSLGIAFDSRRLQNKYFPKIGRGTILITTRNYFTEEDGLAINLDEMMMDDDTALKLLMRKKIRAADADPNALEIVQQLGHLPLAIDLTGALMTMENLTPADFLQKFNEDPIDYLDLKDIQERTGSAYGKTVLTVWSVSFDRIKAKNPLAASLLQCIAFFYPDNIPFVFFRRHCMMVLRLERTPSDRSLSAATNLLQDFSLIRRTREGSSENSYLKNTLTIHRLVQKVILLYMELQDKLQYCERLISSMSHEVPSEFLLNHEHSKMTMEAYVPHIRHVIAQFSQWTDEHYSSNSDELMVLLSPTIVYLIRQGLFEGVENLAKLCVLTSERKNGGLHQDTAAALSKLSYFYVSQNQFELAETHCIRSLRIRRKIFGPIHKETISTLHDLAYIYSGLGMERHATQLYWEAAITGNQDAQVILATRYKKGIGAFVHKKLSSYWRERSLKEECSVELIHLNFDSRLDLTPLHHAVKDGNIDNIRSRIVYYKQYANLGDRDGKTPLHVAVENANIEIIKLLVNGLDSNINIQDDHGQTPLHLAVKNEHITIVKLLITELGADASIMNIDQETPAQLAAESYYFEIMNYIVHEAATATLDLKDNLIGIEGARILAKELKQNSTLTNLNLHRNGIGAKGACTLVKSLNQNTALITLNLYKNGIGINGARALARFLEQNKTLTDLNIGRNRIGIDGARALAKGLKQNTSLIILNLYKNDIGVEGACALAKCLKDNTVLASLNLSRNMIGDKGARALAEYLKQNITLTSLNLYKNEIGAKGASALAEGLKCNKALIKLNLYTNEIGDEGARALAEGLKQNAKITYLNLKRNRIGMDGASALAECLKQNTTLTNLKLGVNLIGSNGTRALAESLERNATLTNLNLEMISIGTEGANALGECLKQNQTLIDLDLKSSRIEDIRALAEGLKQNITLANLNLESTEIHSKGARFLSECLKWNIGLTNLNLSSNAIGDEGACALAEGLKQNTTLTNLNLERNFIGVDGASALAEYLKQNTTYNNLDLRYNPIGINGAHALVECLKQNATLTNLASEYILQRRRSIDEILKRDVLVKENKERESRGSINVKFEEIMTNENKSKVLFEYSKEDMKLDFECDLKSIAIELDISNSGIDHLGAKILADFLKENTTLTDLNLSGNRINAGGVHALARSLMRNTTLISLNLGEALIGDECGYALADVLKQNTTLVNLNLFRCAIGYNGVYALAEALRHNATLINLNLCRNNFGSDGVRALAEGLERNATLTNLNLETVSIGTEGANALGECLKQNQTLIDLNLKSTAVLLMVGTSRNSDAGLKNEQPRINYDALAEGLKQNTTLTNLNLERNNIGVDGAGALAECLKRNATLINLNLGFNSIGNDGAHALAESLKLNRALKYLNLNTNTIDFMGVYSLSEGLRQNTTLIDLDIECNPIHDYGAIALAEGLKQNIALSSLNLGCTNIGDECAYTLAEYLKRNTTLTKLCLGGNWISDKGAYTLAEGLKRNTTLINLNLEANSIGIRGIHVLTLKKTSALTILSGRSYTFNYGGTIFK